MTALFRDLIGLELLDQGDGRATVAITADDRHLNDHGTVHGGVIATLADTAMGMAVASDGQSPVTVEMKVTYVHPGEAGPLQAAALVRKRGKRVTIVEAEVTDGEGELVALALGTFTPVG